MYAVIATGGKQERVEVGSRVEVERLGVAIGDDVTFAPVLVVDGETVLTGPTTLAAASVSARVVGESKGPKIVGFTYQAKARHRRRFGHRQGYSTIEVTEISSGGTAKATARARATKTEKA